MKRWMLSGLVVAVLFTAIAALAWVLDPTRALYAWLVAFFAAYTTATGALLLLLIGDATEAVWLAVLRRPVEAIAGTFPLLAILFVPILLSLARVYPWMRSDELVHGREAWLNAPFFVVRSAIYLLVPAVLAELILSRSRRGVDRAARRRLGAIGLPIAILVVTFAGFDWIMSLEPGYFSTAFGLIPATGGFMAALSLVVITVAILHRRGELADAGPDHLHAIGKLMLTAVCFWTYLAFFQYMLGWIANLPAEARWYLPRTREEWGAIAVALIVLHFVVPFVALLSRELKRRAVPLAILGGGLLLAHWLDVFWLTIPALRRGAPSLHAADLVAALAISGAFLATALFRASRAARSARREDPLLERSLRYRSE